MSRDVREMKPGDFVQVDGRCEEIASLCPGIAPNKPVPRNFYVVTTGGRTVGMWDADAYFKKDDPRP